MEMAAYLPVRLPLQRTMNRERENTLEPILCADVGVSKTTVKPASLGRGGVGGG